MYRDPKDCMSPPPPGAVQCASLGDKPLEAKEDSLFANPEVHVVCVLTGDWPGATREHREKMKDIGAHYVECLYSMVSRYAPRNMRWNFTCFTDRANIQGVPCQPIPSGIYGFFNKLYLFKKGLFPENARVLYFDLDTCLVADWTPLATVPLDKLVLLRDVWAQSQPASGVMSWRVSNELSKIWSDYERYAGQRPPYTHPNPRRYSHGVPGGPMPNNIRTDEQWLYHYTLPHDWSAWQTLLPGKFLSYKYDVLRQHRHDGTQFNRLSPEAARAAHVVYFHGRPRPHEVVAKWNPFWRGLIEAPPPVVTAGAINHDFGN